MKLYQFIIKFKQRYTRMTNDLYQNCIKTSIKLKYIRILFQYMLQAFTSKFHRNEGKAQYIFNTVLFSHVSITDKEML